MEYISSLPLFGNTHNNTYIQLFGSMILGFGILLIVISVIQMIYYINRKNADFKKFGLSNVSVNIKDAIKAGNLRYLSVGIYYVIVGAITFILPYTNYLK